MEHTPSVLRPCNHHTSPGDPYLALLWMVLQGPQEEVLEIPATVATPTTEVIPHRRAPLHHRSLKVTTFAPLRCWRGTGLPCVDEATVAAATRHRVPPRRTHRPRSSPPSATQRLQGPQRLQRHERSTRLPRPKRFKRRKRPKRQQRFKGRKRLDEGTQRSLRSKRSQGSAGS